MGSGSWRTCGVRATRSHSHFESSASHKTIKCFRRHRPPEITSKLIKPTDDLVCWRFHSKWVDFMEKKQSLNFNYKFWLVDCQNKGKNKSPRSQNTRRRAWFVRAAPRWCVPVHGTRAQPGHVFVANASSCLPWPRWHCVVPPPELFVQHSLCK